MQGDDHPRTLTSINNMGSLLNKLSRRDTAANLLLAGVAAARRVWTGENARWLGKYLVKLAPASHLDIASVPRLLLNAEPQIQRGTYCYLIRRSGGSGLRLGSCTARNRNGPLSRRWKD